MTSRTNVRKLFEFLYCELSCYLERSVSWIPGRIGQAIRGFLFRIYTFQLNAYKLRISEDCHIFLPHRMKIGKNLRIGRLSQINAQGGVYIAHDVMIGPFLFISTIDHSFTSTNNCYRKQSSVTAPVFIESNVWIGARVSIMKGVTIGKASVVAAGSVVTRDVPPGVLVAGVPATVKRSI